MEQWHNEAPTVSIYTSGSTGKPKKIALSKKYMRASAEATLQFLGLKPGNTALLCLSPRYIAGLMMLVRAEVGGLKLTLREPAAQPLQEDDHFDFTAMVPYQAQASLPHLHRVENILIGGGALKSSLEKKLALLPSRIFHTYGMTETITHIALRQIAPGKVQDNFKTLPGVSVHADEQHRMVINAPNIGVHHLITNDIVECRDGHAFRWVGRYDNVVNSAGIKLHPEQLEMEIGELPFPYFLAGKPHETWGEELILVLEMPEPWQPVEEKIIEHQLQKLAPYFRPKSIWTTHQFEYTSSGKIRRKATLENPHLQKL